MNRQPLPAEFTSLGREVKNAKSNAIHGNNLDFRLLKSRCGPVDLKKEMKTKLSAMITIGAVLFLSACGLGTQSLILGKWEVENAPLKIAVEFHNDGTANITMFGQTLQGTYKLNPENELTWTVNGRTTKAKVNVTATELELTDDQNRTIKYKRK